MKLIIKILYDNFNKWSDLNNFRFASFWINVKTNKNYHSLMMNDYLKKKPDF